MWRSLDEATEEGSCREFKAKFESSWGYLMNSTSVPT